MHDVVAVQEGNADRDLMRDLQAGKLGAGVGVGVGGGVGRGVRRKGLLMLRLGLGCHLQAQRLRQVEAAVLDALVDRALEPLHHHHRAATDAADAVESTDARVAQAGQHRRLAQKLLLGSGLGTGLGLRFTQWLGLGFTL